MNHRLRATTRTSETWRGAAQQSAWEGFKKIFLLDQNYQIFMGVGFENKHIHG